MAIDAVKRFGDVVRETPELKNNPGLAPLRAKLLKEPQAFFKTLRDRLQADKETTPDSLAPPGVGELRPGQPHGRDRRQAGRPASLRGIAGDPGAAGAREPVGHHSSRAIWPASHNNIGNLRARDGPAGGGAGVVRAGPRDPGAAGAREPVGHPVPERPGQRATTTSDGLQRAMGRPEAGWRRTSRPARSGSGWRARTRRSHSSRATWPAATTTSALTGRPARSGSGWLRENPSVAQFQSDLGMVHHNIGNREQEAGRWAEALASYKKARAIRERLVSENPSVTQFQRDLAWSHHNVGCVQSDMGRTAEALASYQRAFAIRERLARENPSVIQFQRELAASHNHFGMLHRATGQPAEALASYEQARAIWERLAREHPELPEFESLLGATLNNMASIEIVQGKFEKARARIQTAIEGQQKALATNPNNPTYRRRLNWQLRNLILATGGRILADKGDEARRERGVFLDSDPRFLALDARLAAVLKGKETPKDEVERTRLAYRAYQKSLHGASARLFAEAFANDPKLADDRQAQNRYNAARAASLAASGQGKDEPPPDDSSKANLRRQARDWLQAELTAWTKILDTGPADLKVKIATTLQHWKDDPDLAGIRDEKELAKLPAEERAAFQQLWTDVDQLVIKAATGK